MDECSYFKFSRQVDYNKSQPTDNKPSLKGAWSRHMTHFYRATLCYLGICQQCHLCRVAGNTVWSHMACEFP